MVVIEEVGQLDEALIEDLLHLWERSARATHTFLTEQDITALRPDVRQGFAFVHLTLARENGIVLGFSGIHGDSLEMLFADAHARGQGLGRSLLLRAIQRGISKLDVNEQNPQALHFYEHMGFSVVGRSDTDNQGRPFPLLHMELSSAKN